MQERNSLEKNMEHRSMVKKSKWAHYYSVILTINALFDSFKSNNDFLASCGLNKLKWQNWHIFTIQSYCNKCVAYCHVLMLQIWSTSAFMRSHVSGHLINVNPLFTLILALFLVHQLLREISCLWLLNAPRCSPASLNLAFGVVQAACTGFSQKKKKAACCVWKQFDKSCESEPRH